MPLLRKFYTKARGKVYLPYLNMILFPQIKPKSNREKQKDQWL